MKTPYKHIARLTQFCDLKKPVYVAFVPCVIWEKSEAVNACYQPVLSEGEILEHHLITLSCENRKTRDIINCLAHEFIHAWQMENGLEYLAHDEKFEFMAIALGDTYGYKIYERQL